MSILLFLSQLKINELVDAHCRHFDNSIVPFNEVFPLPWIESYDTNKWVGYVFGQSRLATRPNYDTIKGILEAELEMEFNDKSIPKLN